MLRSEMHEIPRDVPITIYNWYMQFNSFIRCQNYTFGRWDRFV